LKADTAESRGYIGSMVEWSGQVFYWLAPVLSLVNAVIIAGYAVCEVYQGQPNPAVWVIVLLSAILAFALAHARKTHAAGATIILGMLSIVTIAGVVFLSVMLVADRIHDAPSAIPKTVYVLGADGNPVATQPDITEAATTSDMHPDSSAFTYHFADANHLPTSAATPSVPGTQYQQASEVLIVIALPLFQFMAALRPVNDASATRGRPGLIATLVITTWIASGVLAWLINLWAARFNAYAMATSPYFAPSTTSAPIGDSLQLFGAWAFGSARAGWWLMMSAVSFMVLVLCAAAWASFAVGPDILPICIDFPANSKSRRYPRILLRAAIVAGLTAVGVLCLFVWQSAAPPPFYNGPTFGSQYLHIVSRYPDLISTLSLCLTLAFVVLCAATCVGGRMKFAAIIGLLACLALLAFLVDAGMDSAGAVAKPLLWAATISAIWGAVVAIGRGMKKRREVS
jgi:hypothetical protein